MTIIGSGTSVPLDGRGAPGYLVRVSGEAIAFDLGPGTVHRWSAAGVSCLDVGEVYVTHLHPDHIADLVTFLFALRNPYFKRTKPLRIIGPVGLMDHYRGLMNQYGYWVEEEGYELSLTENSGMVSKRDGYTVTSRLVRHTSTSLGYRVETPDGRVFAYSGDTDTCEAIIELGRRAQVMVLECSVPDERRIEGHLTPALAGEIAAECGVEKLVLTHFYPLFQGIDIVERVRKVYGGEVILAEDLMRIEV